MPEKMGWESARVVVWYDNASGNLCFGNRAGLEIGEALPPEKIYQIPVSLTAEFFDAVMNIALGESFREDAEDYDKIMYGVQKLLDSRVVRAIEVAEGFRIARSKAAGGGTIGVLNEQVVVQGERHGKLLDLLKRVKELTHPGAHIRETNVVVEELTAWLDSSGLLED